MARFLSSTQLVIIPGFLSTGVSYLILKIKIEIIKALYTSNIYIKYKILVLGGDDEFVARRGALQLDEIVVGAVGRHERPGMLEVGPLCMTLKSTVARVEVPRAERRIRRSDAFKALSSHLDRLSSSSIHSSISWPM